VEIRYIFIFLFIIPFLVLIDEISIETSNLEFDSFFSSNFIEPLKSLKTLDGSLVANLIGNLF